MPPKKTGRLSKEKQEEITPPETRACKRPRDIWYDRREYCIDTCEECNEIHLLKKLYWELRKINDRGIK